MPIINQRRYSVSETIHLFNPHQRNKAVLREFFTQYPDADLSGLYRQHELYKTWIHPEHSWQLAWLNGDMALLKDWLARNPKADKLADQYDANIAHFAAWSGQAECLFAILKRYPRLKDSTDQYGANIAHFAAWSGQAECLFAVLERYPHLKDSTDKYGANIAHYAAWSGQAECLFAVLERYPHLKDSTNKSGANIAHYAAVSGQADCLFAVLERYPHLKDSTDKYGANIAHFAAESKSNNEQCLKTVLLRYPAFIASVEHPEGFKLETTLNIQKIVADVTSLLEQQYLATCDAEHASSQVKGHDPRFDAVKASSSSASSSASRMDISEDAQTHISEYVKAQIENLVEEGVTEKDIKEALHLLQQVPFDITTQSGRENDKRLETILAGKDCELKYAVLDPASMSKDIKPAQVESARAYLFAQLTEQGNSLVVSVGRKKRIKHKKKAAASSVAAQGMFAPVDDDAERKEYQLQALPKPPETVPESVSKTRAYASGT